MLFTRSADGVGTVKTGRFENGQGHKRFLHNDRWATSDGQSKEKEWPIRMQKWPMYDWGRWRRRKGFCVHCD